MSEVTSKAHFAVLELLKNSLRNFSIDDGNFFDSDKIKAFYGKHMNSATFGHTIDLPFDIYHYTPLLFLTPIIFFIRMFLRRFFYLAARFRHFTEASSKKISESLYFFVQYCMLTIFSWSLLYMLDAFPYNLENFFLDYPNRFSYNVTFNMFFFIEFVIYIVSTVFLFFDPQKCVSDTVVMVMHHTICVILTQAGYLCRHFSWGICLSVLHDVNDIFLEGSKSLNLIFGEPLSLYSFMLFALSYLVFRIILYPSYLLLPVMTGVCDNIANERYHHGLGCVEGTLHRVLFYAILWSLYIIDCFWFYSIVRMLIGLIKDEVRGDIRDSEEVYTGRFGKNKEKSWLEKQRNRKIMKLLEEERKKAAKAVANGEQLENIDINCNNNTQSEK